MNIYSESSESVEIELVKNKQEEIRSRLRSLAIAVIMSCDMMENIEDDAKVWRQTQKTIDLVSYQIKAIKKTIGA